MPYIIRVRTEREQRLEQAIAESTKGMRDRTDCKQYTTPSWSVVAHLGAFPLAWGNASLPITICIERVLLHWMARCSNRDQTISDLMPPLMRWLAWLCGFLGKASYSIQSEEDAKQYPFKIDSRILLLEICSSCSQEKMKKCWMTTQETIFFTAKSWFFKVIKANQQ